MKTIYTHRGYVIGRWADFVVDGEIFHRCSMFIDFPETIGKARAQAQITNNLIPETNICTFMVEATLDVFQTLKDDPQERYFIEDVVLI